MPAIFGQHDDGSQLVITQGHRHTDDALVTTHTVPVYNGRIFLPCGVYSQRMQFAQDVIAPVPSAPYAQDTARHVSTVCGWRGRDEPQRRGECWGREQVLCGEGSWLYDGLCIEDDKVYCSG